METIRYLIKDKIIRQRRGVLGVEGENNATCIEFEIPKDWGSTDLSTGKATVHYQLPSGKCDNRKLKMSVEDDENLVMRWTVGAGAVQEAGHVEVYIQIVCGTQIWKTERTVFEVKQSTRPPLSPPHGCRPGMPGHGVDGQILQYIIENMGELVSSPIDVDGDELVYYDLDGRQYRLYIGDVAEIDTQNLFGVIGDDAS